MRGLSALPLDDDIVDRVLTFLPCFSALRATLLASKHFHTVFKTHPNSIIRAVAYNITGPALPQAMRVIRYSPRRLDSEGNSESTPPPTPWAETNPISPITGDEARQLTTNAAVVSTLEALFSSRHKDRTSQDSKLLPAESERFRCAMYRLMLLCGAFPLSEDEVMEVDEVVTESKLKRKQLLEEFPNYELLAVHSVSLFLTELFDWTEIAQDASQYDTGLALSQGPEVILSAYQTRSTDAITENLSELGIDVDDVTSVDIEYLSYPLSKIWEERRMKPPPDDPSHWKSILDVIHGEHDTCHRCSAVHGFSLWNETNWEYLRGFDSIRPAQLRLCIKGNLPTSIVENLQLRNQLFHWGFTYTALLQEIHDLRTSEFNTWDKRDWLCLQCIVEIIKSHMHLWLLERKRKAGMVIHEDCWYGYNCRTQTHNSHHASRLNHLCEPTR